MSFVDEIPGLAANDGVFCSCDCLDTYIEIRWVLDGLAASTHELFPCCRPVLWRNWNITRDAAKLPPTLQLAVHHVYDVGMCVHGVNHRRLRHSARWFLLCTSTGIYRYMYNIYTHYIYSCRPSPTPPSVSRRLVSNIHGFGEVSFKEPLYGRIFFIMGCSYMGAFLLRGLPLHMYHPRGKYKTYMRTFLDINMKMKVSLYLPPQ